MLYRGTPAKLSTVHCAANALPLSRRVRVLSYQSHAHDDRATPETSTLSRHRAAANERAAALLSARCLMTECCIRARDATVES